MASPGRVARAREKAETRVRYCPLRSGWRVVSDHWPLLIGRGHAGKLHCSIGFAAGLSVSRMIEPGAAVPENSG